MPTETLSPAQVIEAPEVQEADYNAADFYDAFSSVYDLQRHILATALHVKPYKISPSYIGEHLEAEHGNALLQKVKTLVYSDINSDFVERSIQAGSSSPVLAEEQTRNYMSGLARDALVAGIIDVVKNKNGRSRGIRSDDMSRLVAVNRDYVQLVDSEYGRQLGFTRNDLRGLLHKIYGAYDGATASLPDRLEAGLATEIATKRYLESLAGEQQLEVDYANVKEDLNGIDIICRRGDSQLWVNTKSSDKNIVGEMEAAASHTKLEQKDIGIYEVRQLHPASHATIDNDFGIKGNGYSKQIDDVVQEFNSLTKFTL